MPRLKKLWSEIKYWIFILIFLGFLFEMVASMVLYRKYTTGKLAIFHFTETLFKKGAGEAAYKMHENARPDSSNATNKKIADESLQSSSFSYEPFMMFRVADFESQYVNVSGFERKSSPSTYINTSSKDTLEVYFFGGSSMYGSDVADAETIPSQFLKILQKDNPGKSVRVRNFGVPYYYSKQQLILYSSLLFAGHRPDIVIFLNGMDDFYPARMLYYDRPHFSYALQQTFEGKMFQKKDPSFTDSTDQFYNDPSGIDANEFRQGLYNKYVNNLKQSSALSEKAGVKSYFFCQPVPFYNYPNRPADNTFKGNYTRFEQLYPELEKNPDSIKNFFFLGNMLKDEKGNAFIEGSNYSPAFSQKVATQILEAVKKDVE